MKCDKLESYYYYEDRVFTPATHTYRVYHADEVDAAIAELKAEVNNLLIQNQELCQALQVTCSVEEYTELKVENCGLRRATNRELARWLTQGNGQVLIGEIKYPYWNYSCRDGDEVPDMKVRKWSDTEWHEPTVEYLFGGDK